MKRALARVLTFLALLAFVVVVLELAHDASLLPGSNGGTQFEPGQDHTYPSPSDWSRSPYPVASARIVPSPQVTVAPCPQYVPPGGWHYPPGPPPPLVPTTLADGTHACIEPGGVRPDPGTGPVIASPTP